MSAMRGYGRDEYENWDEYEEDGEDEYEDEAGEEYEEPEAPTQEQLDYLELRQRLKESHRKRMKKEMGTANAGSRDKTNSFRKDDFGSFFGPSRPVIAQRVIQESKSLLENPNLAARISKSNHTHKKSSSSVPVKSKPQGQARPSTVASGVKRKAEMIKSTRDYSFLLSDEADLPAAALPPARNPPLRNVLTPKSDARTAQVSQRGKQGFNDRERLLPNGRDGSRPIQPNGQGRPKVVHDRVSKSPVEPRRLLGNSNGSGPGRPIGVPKSIPPKSSAPPARKGAQPIAKSTMAGSHRLSTSSHDPGVRGPTPSQDPGARRPTASSHLQAGMHRPAPPRGQPSSALNRSSGQRRDHQETSKPKAITKPAMPLSRDQVKRPPPRPAARDERMKAIPKRRPDDDSDDEEAINMIRQMFRYNPNKYQDMDDDSDMEANFDDIQREEFLSGKIAQQEDEEQLRLIEEEERRERRMAKKRKLGR